MKSSGGAAAGKPRGSLRTTACQRLVLPVPAGGPRGDDPGVCSAHGNALLQEVSQALLWLGGRRCPFLPNGDWKRGEKVCSRVCGWPETGPGWRRQGTLAPNPPLGPASQDPETPLSHHGARCHTHYGRSAVIRARTRLAAPLPSARSREKRLRSRPATCRGGSGRRSWWSGRLTPSTGGIRWSRRREGSVALVALLLDPQWTSQGLEGWSGLGAGGWVCGGSRGRGWLLGPGSRRLGGAWVALRAAGSGTGSGEAEKGDALWVRSSEAFPRGTRRSLTPPFQPPFQGRVTPCPAPFLSSLGHRSDNPKRAHHNRAVSKAPSLGMRWWGSRPLGRG